ncbi:HIT domain-containing protein [Thermodesulfobacteriota bacterium]
MEYILEADKDEGCVFCKISKEEPGEENLIVYKGEKSLVIMNKFPYNNGHIMVMPYGHKGDLADLSSEERLDLMNNLDFSVENLKKLMAPQGFNIGLNLGRSAGAGVEGHLHFHIVPRWNGDTNFMTVFDDVRVVPEHIIKTYRKLYDTFNLDK